MAYFENIWILEGSLRTRHGPAIRSALAAAFPLADDPEEEGIVVGNGPSTSLHWRTTAPMTFDTLVGAIQSAAPDAVGTLTVGYPYSNDPSPTFLVFTPDGVSAHAADWAMAPEPFRQWSAPSADQEPLDCPVCHTPQAMAKRVNEERNEIWVCTACSAVVFTFYDAASLARLAQVLSVPELH